MSAVAELDVAMTGQGGHPSIVAGEWVAAGAVAVGLAALALAIDGADPWSSLAPASCVTSGCFCEAPRSAVLRQPANAVSSFAFLVPGLAIAGGGLRRWSAPGRALATRPVPAVVFGAAVSLVGLGSAWFHASLSFAGQTADLFGMYLVATFAALVAWSKHRPLTDAAFAAIFASSNLALAGGLLVAPDARRVVFGVIAVAGIALELTAPPASRAARRRAGGAVAAMLGGTLVWALDATHAWCDPLSPWQGHAAWHVAGAVAVGLLFSAWSRA